MTATLRMPPEARRLPLANLFCRGTVSVILLAAASRIAPYVTALPAGPSTRLSLFHTAFNLFAAACSIFRSRAWSRRS